MLAQVLEAPKKSLKNLITNEVTTVFLTFLCTSITYTIRRLSISGFRQWLYFIAMVLFISSCGSQNETEKDLSKIRLITLSPHLAELVASAGAIDNLVGVVSYSDFPKQVKSITNIGDAFKVDFESIMALKPDYVLSWKGGTPAATVTKLKSLNINVIDTEVNQLSDIPKTIEQIALLTNTLDAAALNITLFEKTIKEFNQLHPEKQSLFIQTYHQPLYTVSSEHWISKAVEICGFENIFSELSQSSATVNIESVINKNPQAILNISKQKDQQWQKWNSIRAVKNNKIYTIDPDYLSRPSMRILKGIKQLCDY